MEKREKTSKLIFFTFILFLFWSLLQILSPLILPSNSILDLSGLTAIVDNNHITKTMPFPINIMYSMSDRLCHQQSDRSFFLNGNQMPFCSRCTAICIGCTIGLAIVCIFTVTLDERFIFILIFSLIPLGIDGIGQLFGFWESTNIIRLLTGLITGIAVGMAIGILIDEGKSLVKSKNVNN